MCVLKYNNQILLFLATSAVVGFHDADYQPQREMVSEIVLPLLKNKGMYHCFALDMIHASGQIIVSATKIAANYKSNIRQNNIEQDEKRRLLYIQSTPLGKMKNKIFINTYMDGNSEASDAALTDLQVTLTVSDALRRGIQLTAAFTGLRQCPVISESCEAGTL